VARYFILIVILRASGILIVTPTDETSCPKQPCHTSCSIQQKSIKQYVTVFYLTFQVFVQLLWS